MQWIAIAICIVFRCYIVKYKTKQKDSSYFELKIQSLVEVDTVTVALHYSCFVEIFIYFKIIINIYSLALIIFGLSGRLISLFTYSNML